MKILCTGNPLKQTIAHAVKQRWSTATCVSLSQGWNLLLPSVADEQQFRELVSQHNVFINASYISQGAQARLLNLVCQQWTKDNVCGHIVTIGTTAEYSNDLRYKPYIEDKKTLRQLSLNLNDQTGVTGVKTTYLILGGLNDGKPENADYPTPQSVVNVVNWVIEFPDRIAVIQLEKQKQTK